MTVTIDNKSNHDQKIRRAHISAINVIKNAFDRNPENQARQDLLEKSEAYHLACLHRQWFSLSRRENERIIAQQKIR